MSSLDKIFNPVQASFSLIVFIGLIFSVAVKLWQGLFYKFVGKKINSTTIFANSADSINDVISTTIVLVGLIISEFSGLNFDGYLGLIVAIFIIYSGIKLVIETCKPLLGEAPSKTLVNEIREKVMEYDDILGIHDLMVHSYGAGKIFASLHCEVSSSVSIMKSHDLMDNIERDFFESMGIHMVIHMDPVDNDNEKTNGLREKIKFFVLEKYPNSSIHDFRVVWGIDHSNIVFDVCMPFSEKDSDEKISKNITEIISEINQSYRLILTIDRI